ncbi:MAG: hypothetical protein Q8O22_05015 [Candidatus Omnitrophota bacterium]|nr:hypothetical protein [Candidatus Omnitrophota bacterium]
MKLEEKNKARQLRQGGFSLKQIAAALDVSKGSVSGWVRDIELSADLLGNIDDQRRLARERARITRLSNIADKNREISLKCKEEILPVSNRDLWMSGLMLYAGEGYKSKMVSNQRVELANSDPDILRLFISFLLSVCSVPKNKIIMRLMLYEDIDLKEAHKYWSEQLDIPESQFRKSFIKQSFRDIENRHLRRSEYGTAHVHVYDVVLYRKIMGWINAIYEYNNLNFNKA